MNRPTDGRVLLVGEGNFSLSASLVNSSGILSGPQMVTTSLDTRGAVEDTHRLAASNIALLVEAGAMVLFEVDARELHNHPEIRFFEFSRIIFNFPLADRHNIKKNRALLSEFFNSAVRVLDRQTGQVMVTLCKGQGGTPADQPMRSWHDSWQVVSMATDAGLILTEVLPFQAEDFGSYESVGFRFQDKGFNTENALIHIFEVAATVRASDGSGRRCFIQQNEEDFAVPAYIRHKLDSWSLLEKENHPIASLHQHIMARLQSEGPVTVLPTNDNRLPRVLPGYKSSLSVNSPSVHSGRETADPEMDVDTEDGSVDVVSSSKDLKEMKNRACAAATAAGDGVEKSSPGEAMETSPKSFKHGVDRGEDANQQVQKRDEKGQCSKQLGDVSSDAAAALVRSPFLIPVYVLHRINPSSPTVPSTHSSGGHSGAACVNQTESCVGNESESGGNTNSSEMDECSETASATLSAAANTPSTEHATESSPQISDAQEQADSRPSNSLLHLRSSLLENVPHLLDFLKRNPAKHQTAAMSGIVFRKCPISPVELPASHETLILSRSENEMVDEFGKKLFASVKDAVSAEFAEKLCIQHLHCKVNVGAYGQTEIVSTLTGQSQTGVTVLGHVFKFESTRRSSTEGHSRGCEAGDSTNSAAQASDNTSSDTQASDINTASETGSEPISSEPVFGAVLYLDTVVSLALRLPDTRLLWSEDHRFISQFRKEHQPPLPLHVFKPFSLYPVRFVHDLSFWENPDRIFEEPEFFDIVRDVADDAVVKVTLIDKFESADTGKTSRCYRLVFQSHDRALSYITSWKLQSMIRLKVAHNLGITLR